MTRWSIEKSGTGIEKSGTGIEKSGTGIEKSGTGIEKSGTGIEKSGTGIRRGVLACSLAAAVFASGANANEDPRGDLMLSLDRGAVKATWHIAGGVFFGTGAVQGAFSSFDLIELAPAVNEYSEDIAGGGTGKAIAGGGTGKAIAGGGTGKAIAGGGTGKAIAGGGTGKAIAGGGTGKAIAGGGTGKAIAGGGTGKMIAGGGTGRSVMIAGGGTGVNAIEITLPAGTEMSMEIDMACDGSANVYVLDLEGFEVAVFEDVKVKGAVNTCGTNDIGLPSRGGWNSGELPEIQSDWR